MTCTRTVVHVLPRFRRFSQVQMGEIYFNWNKTSIKTPFGVQKDVCTDCGSHSNLTVQVASVYFPLCASFAHSIKVSLMFDTRDIKDFSRQRGLPLTTPCKT